MKTYHFIIVIMLAACLLSSCHKPPLSTNIQSTPDDTPPLTILDGSGDIDDIYFEIHDAQLYYFADPEIYEYQSGRDYLALLSIDIVMTNNSDYNKKFSLFFEAEAVQSDIFDPTDPTPFDKTKNSMTEALYDNIAVGGFESRQFGLCDIIASDLADNTDSSISPGQKKVIRFYYYIKNLTEPITYIIKTKRTFDYNYDNEYYSSKFAYKYKDIRIIKTYEIEEFYTNGEIKLNQWIDLD